MGEERAGGFPPTRRSLVAALGDEDPRERRAAWDALARAYWPPVHHYLRLRFRLGESEAEDLTQGFFAFVLEKGQLERFDAGRARFRTWLRRCLDGYVANERAASQRRKRGGLASHVSIEGGGGEAEDGEGSRGIDIPVESDLDELFHREWVRATLAAAVDDLREASEAAGRARAFAIFLRHDLAEDDDARPSYADLAAEFGVPATTVTNALHAMRRRYRDAVRERLRALCATDEEFRSELRALLGEDPR